MKYSFIAGGRRELAEAVCDHLIEYVEAFPEADVETIKITRAASSVVHLGGQAIPAGHYEIEIISRYKAKTT